MIKLLFTDSDTCVCYAKYYIYLISILSVIIVVAVNGQSYRTLSCVFLGIVQNIHKDGSDLIVITDHDVRYLITQLNRPVAYKIQHLVGNITNKCCD